VSIYLKENRESCFESSAVILATIKDNISALQVLNQDYQKLGFEEKDDHNKQARLITFACTAIEKLLLLHLYARNPLFLLSDKEITKKELLEKTDYKDFCHKWLIERSQSFVGPEEMWEILEKLLHEDGCGSLEEFRPDYHYIKKIRNKYLHATIDHIAPKSFYLIKFYTWLLLIKLLESLPDDLEVDCNAFLSQCGLSEEQVEALSEVNTGDLREKVISTFPKILAELSHKKDMDSKRSLMLHQLFTKSFLEKEIQQYDHEGQAITFLSPDGDEVSDMDSREEVFLRDECNINCPECRIRKNVFKTGFISIDVAEVHHHQNGDGDYETWNEPSEVEFDFGYFYCVECGVHTDDYYLLEKIGYGTALKNKFGVTWDINQGVTGYFLKQSGFSIGKPWHR